MYRVIAATSSRTLLLTGTGLNDVDGPWNEQRGQREVEARGVFDWILAPQGCRAHPRLVPPSFFLAVCACRISRQISALNKGPCSSLFTGIIQR